MTGQWHRAVAFMRDHLALWLLLAAYGIGYVSGRVA